MSDHDERPPAGEAPGGDRPLSIPSELAVLPLRDTVLFPNSFMPLAVARESSVRLVDDAVAGGKLIGVFTQRDPTLDEPGADDLYPVGVATHIHKMFKLPDGSLRLIVQGLSRLHLEKLVSLKPYLRAAVVAAEERLLDALVGPGSQPATRDSFRKKLRAGELDDKEVELQLADTGGGGMFEIPGQPGASVLNLSEMMKSFGGGRTKVHRTTVAAAHAPLIAEESDKLLDQEALTQEAIELAENHGIVFLDEIDKVASSSQRGGADVSREGVQRDLLPLIEGTTVSTKYGPVKTDHILFIASGAFHVAKPSDLLPELQGRLPIRVELKGLTRDDLRRILTEPEANLIR